MGAEEEGIPTRIVEAVAPARAAVASKLSVDPHIERAIRNGEDGNGQKGITSIESVTAEHLTRL